MTPPSNPAPGQPVDTPITVPVGTKEADPTLGVLPHAISVGVGLLAAYLSTKFSVSLSAGTQEEIATAIGTIAGTAVHYIMAHISAKAKGA